MTKLLRATLLGGLAICASLPALAQEKPAPIGPKLQPYIGCINRLSERSYSSRDRYLSWSKESGPTGKERIIYGLYTIYDTSDCRKNVEKAAEMAPKNEELEKAGAAFAAAVGALEPLLKEADDYYSQENYKDDKMAKGKAMHPRLMAAWGAFAAADRDLRGVVQKLNDISQREEMAEVEKREGRKARWHVMDTMLKAKALNRVEGNGDPAKMDLAKVQERARQGSLQFRRADDAEPAGRGLDDRRLAAAPDARLQRAGQPVQFGRTVLGEPASFPCLGHAGPLLRRLIVSRTPWPSRSARKIRTRRRSAAPSFSSWKRAITIPSAPCCLMARPQP